MYFMYFYEIFRLIFIAVLLVYFIGCIIYLVSDKMNNDEDYEKGNTFV